MLESMLQLLVNPYLYIAVLFGFCLLLTGAVLRLAKVVAGLKADQVAQDQIINHFDARELQRDVALQEIKATLMRLEAYWCGTATPPSPGIAELPDGLAPPTTSVPVMRTMPPTLPPVTPVRVRQRPLQLLLGHK